MDHLKSRLISAISKLEASQHKRQMVIFTDLLLIISAYFFAFMLRFEMRIPADFLLTMLKTFPLVILIRLCCFWHFGLYKGIWRFASIEDLISIFKASSAGSVFIVLSLYFINQFKGYPRSVFFIDWLLILVFVGGLRFSIRFVREVFSFDKGTGKRVLIMGAGSAGESILRQMIMNKKLGYNPVGLIDDEPLKKGLKLHGIKVLGKREDIPEIVRTYGIEEIIISIPSGTSEQIKRIIDQCLKSGARFKTAPALSELTNGDVHLSQIRDVQMEDLLGRVALEVDLDKIREEFFGKKVLVTGAGGSIGRELCRQIAKFQPEKLVLFDHSENSVFYTERSLREAFPNLECIPLVADVSDRRSADRILGALTPHIIFHAAAHKHVPLMELNPIEAIRNNVLGTKIMADLAIKHHLEKFVFISTDKAVNPISFMGATKRVGELYVASLAQANTTKFISVRFGNVIGSTGSVVRLFKEQIQQGGPVTVTHPEICRFLMTIPEAVQLILQASSMGRGGEVFVLDMGKPIKIMDLANTMIRLSGLEPIRDVPIIITGLRPGEKLEEELFDAKDERLNPSSHSKIFIIESLSEINYELVKVTVSELEKSVQRLEEKELFGKFNQLVHMDSVKAEREWSVIH